MCCRSSKAHSLARNGNQSFELLLYLKMGFPGNSDYKESVCNAGDLDLIPGSARSPGESHGQGSLVGYSPWNHKESDKTEQPTFLVGLKQSFFFI